MPRVWNKRDPRVPAEAVYVGRPTLWGNPFSHLPHTLARFQVGSRDEAVHRYEQMLLQNKALMDKAKRELKGKDLVCWCAPASCHADVLMRIANQED